MPVQIAEVKAAALRDAGEYVATLRARQSVQIQPQITGYVTRILVAPGARVSPQTVLMQIDPSRQQAAVNSQRAVRDANRANLEYWRKQYGRIQKLQQGGAATRQDLDQAQTSLRQAEAAFASSAAQVRAGAVELRYYRVTAPTAGLVGDIPVRIGDFVTPQTLLTTLDDNDVLEAYIDLPIERAVKVKPGTQVEIIDNAGQVLAASTVSFVSPRADPAAQLVLVKANIENQSGALRSSQFARARVIWSRREMPVVPVLAVQSRAGQSFVWVVKPAPGGGLTAEPRPVQVGPIQEQNFPVTKGLQVGERIVVSGVQKLRPGAPVAPIDAKATQGHPGAGG